MRSIPIDDFMDLFECCMEIIPYWRVGARIGSQNIGQAEEREKEVVSEGVEARWCRVDLAFGC